MQPLKLESGRCGRQLEYRRDAVRVMSRELRINHIAMFEQSTGAREIRYIGGELARVDRVTVEPALLAALNLGVPIRSFDQAHGDLSAMVARGGSHPLYDMLCALAIRLYRESQAGPRTRGGISAQRFDTSRDKSRR